MRKLKTPEEIIEEAWGNYTSDQDKMVGIIKAAQRDALECAAEIGTELTLAGGRKLIALDGRDEILNLLPKE